MSESDLSSIASASASQLSRRGSFGPGGGARGHLRRRSSFAEIPSENAEKVLQRAHHGGQTVEESREAIHNMEENTFWHALTTRDCLRTVGMRHPDRGLTAAEVVERREALGDNSLDEGKSRSWWAIVLPQFINWMSAILFAVFILSIVMKEYIEAIVVVLVIFLNGTIGAWQELRSEASLNAIRDLARGTARVRRDGVVRIVDIQEVVVGDIIEVREGDMVPADVRFLEATRLEIDEAALTGESVPVHKTTAVLEDANGTLAIGDRTNMGFRQTWVSQGHGTGVVVAVGSSTQIGKVAERLTTTDSGSTKTPLMREMDQLMLFLFILGLVFAFFIIWAFRWRADSNSLLYASATLVAILPEVGIVLLNVVMALGSRRMAEQNAIVRRLTSLERLGKVTDICSDKTGTLTCGKMQAVRVWLASEIGVGEAGAELVARPLVAAGRPMSSIGHWHREEVDEPVLTANSLESSISDDEYDDDDDYDDEDEEREMGIGMITRNEGNVCIPLPPIVERPRVPSVQQQAILRQEWTLGMMAAALCSSTFVEASDEGRLTGTGNPTELALQVLAHQGSLARESFLIDWEPRGEWAFDSTAKRMSVGWRHRDLPVGLIITKGAPERILSVCSNLVPGSEEMRRIEEAAVHLARQGLRVLALAYRVVRNGNPRSHSTGDDGETASQVSGSVISRVSSSHSLSGRHRRDSISRHMDAAHASRSVIASAESTSLVRELVAAPAIAGFLATLEAESLSADQVQLAIGSAQEEEVIDLREQLVGDYERTIIERDLTFIGLVGLRDPPKLESAPAVEECSHAGITVRMLTGDHQETAIAIAEEIGILNKKSIPPVEDEEADVGESSSRWKHLVMTGPQMDRMTVEELDALPDLPLVVARCTPETKVRMVEALHRRSRVVAMTGDGVNDSPAIKAADVGVAMGITGSELTKSVADVVLADDNFATIVTAVREGRRIFSSISKFVLNLLCSNVAEGFALLLSLSFATDDDNLPIFVLSPLAILWLNTATGTGPSMGLSLDPIPSDMMQRPPLMETLFTWELIQDMTVYGTTMGALTLSAFSIVVWGDGSGQLGRNCNSSSSSNAQNCGVAIRGRATAFALLNILLILQAFNCRHDRFSAFSMSWTKNKTLLYSLVGGTIITVVLIYLPFINENVFKHGNISWEWGVVLCGIIVYLLCTELYKYIKRVIWDRKLRMAATSSSQVPPLSGASPAHDLAIPH